MKGNVVLPDERDHLLAAPIEQRIDFDQPVTGSDDRKGGGDTLVGLTRPQAGDPRDRAREGPPQWFGLAHGAARMSGFDGAMNPLMP
jgi:hypothetical protein